VLLLVTANNFHSQDYFLPKRKDHLLSRLDESFGDGEQSEEDEANSESSIGEGDYDETVGELEDEFEGEDGEEPWGIDEYSAEGYSGP
jgi:hypothetical protein